MSFLLEIERVQKRNTLFHKRELLRLKVAVLILVIVSGLFPERVRVYFSTSVIVALSAAVVSIGAGRILLKLLAIYLGLAVIVTPLSLLGGATSLYLLSINLYTISTFVALTFFMTTTPWDQLEDALGENVLVYSYRMVGLSIRDLQRILDSYRARGLELSPWRPWRAVPIFITLMYLTASVRLRIVEESLRARGVEE